MITSVRINNFRSFSDLRLDLGPFNVFVGPNGCGKSNFVDAFRFLKQAVSTSVSAAVSRRGGWNNVRNRKYRANRFTLELKGTGVGITLGVPPPARHSLGESTTPNHYEYAATFAHQKPSDILIIAESALVALALEDSKPQILSAVKRTSKDISVSGLVEQFVSHSRQSGLAERAADKSLLGSPFHSIAGFIIGHMIEHWHMYNLDPAEARRPSILDDSTEMSESGDNLSLILRYLGRSAPHSSERSLIADRIRTIMQALVPDFQSWEPLTLADGRATFRIKEKEFASLFGPESISDGTVRLLSLLAALLAHPTQSDPADASPGPGVLFIEEPERMLHPLVLDQLVQLMREVSSETQIVVTTHSPDFVRHCRPEEVYLMDKIQGTTRIVRASDISHIDKFLQKFSLEELWTMGYLEAGIPNA